MELSRRSLLRASISRRSFRAGRATSTSCPTRSALSSTIVVALGSNLGDLQWYLRRAIEELRHVISIVLVSSIIETDPVDAPRPKYLNAVVLGYTRLSPEELLDELQRIENRLGRRRTTRNAPRTIDLDLILHSANLRQTPRLMLPHPRAHDR